MKYLIVTIIALITSACGQAPKCKTVTVTEIDNCMYDTFSDNNTRACSVHWSDGTVGVWTEGKAKVGDSQTFCGYTE